MQMHPGDLPDIAMSVLERVRARAPRVHCITNTVAQAYTANMLLAAGAVPSMTTSTEEIAAFASGADALLVNLGTLDPERGVAIDRALSALTGQPWVLDPVFVDRSATRAAFAASLLGRQPTAVRLNRAELATLARGQDQAGFAAQARSIIAISGATDTVTDGARTLSLANGDPLMAKVTAMGCSGSALLAARFLYYGALVANPYHAKMGGVPTLSLGALYTGAFLRRVGAVEADGFQQPFHHRRQPPGADVLRRLIDVPR